MKNLTFLAALFVVAANCFSQTTLADFKVMAGCWESRDDSQKLLISEQWMSPAGTSMLGIGRTVKKDKTTDWEFMRIEQRPDGIFYVAKPKANSTETDFKLISTDSSKFVFENKAHDFPQRVIYTVTKDTFTGRIEGEINGKPRAVDFPVRRVNCG
jgi:hypothetical protein